MTDDDYPNCSDAELQQFCNERLLPNLRKRGWGAIAAMAIPSPLKSADRRITELESRVSGSDTHLQTLLDEVRAARADFRRE